MFVDRVVLPTPPLAENTVMMCPSWPVPPADVAEQPRGELAAAAQGVGERRVVVGGDDLAHPAAQRQAERRDVDAVAQEDDAQLGPVEARRLGQLARRARAARPGR